MTTLYRELQCEVRGIDEATRSAEFVASTENPVRMYGGAEVLRMSGIDLKRYSSNPVLLDSHDRSSIKSVLGRTEARVEGRKLVARAFYAPTDAGEAAWKLVKGGFVRAMSIGYTVDPAKVRRIGLGEQDGEGDAAVRGPASIVNGWELAEISNVPVPADADAVRRSFYDGIPQGKKERPVNKLTRAMGEASNASPPADDNDESETPEIPAKPAPKPAARTYAQDLFEELFARRLKAITPPELHGEIHRCLLQGWTFEESRKHLLDVFTARHAPIGTPDATSTLSTDEERAKSLHDLSEVSDDVLVRSLENLTQ